MFPWCQSTFIAYIRGKCALTTIVSNPGYNQYLHSTGLADMRAQAEADPGQLLVAQSAIVTAVQTMQTQTVVSICTLPLVLLLRTR